MLSILNTLKIYFTLRNIVTKTFRNKIILEEDGIYPYYFSMSCHDVMYGFRVFACIIILDCLRERRLYSFSFDISKKDGYLNYYEIELFQRLTDPQLPLDVQLIVILFDF